MIDQRVRRVGRRHAVQVVFSDGGFRLIRCQMEGFAARTLENALSTGDGALS